MSSFFSRGDHPYLSETAFQSKRAPFLKYIIGETVPRESCVVLMGLMNLFRSLHLLYEKGTQENGRQKNHNILLNSCFPLQSNYYYYFFFMLLSIKYGEVRDRFREFTSTAKLLLFNHRYSMSREADCHDKGQQVVGAGS